jgi:cytoskeleton protein RodZ
MQPNDIETETTPPAKGPGGQLRQARLALKLAPEDVAQILHLSPRQIVALEGDDYAHLPGPTYIRGYLRGYAQLLGLSPEAVVAAYGGLPTAAPKVEPARLAPEPQLSSDHQGMRFATLGVLALVFGLAVVWWLGREDTTPKPVPVAIGQPAESVPVPAAAPGGVETTVDAANGKPGVVTVAPPVPASVDPQSAKSAAAPAAPKPAAAVAPAPTAPVPKPAAQANPVAQGPRERLVLTASADSWADVRDAEQNKLLYETLRPGQTVTIEGRAPIAVFLGNADAVKLEYNGKPFDVAPYKRGVFARFNLAAPAAPVPAPEAANGARQQ